MNDPAALIQKTKDARNELLNSVRQLTNGQASYKPSLDVWSINEKLEQLVLAEVSGVSKIWSAAEGIRAGRAVWVGEHTNRGSSIEEVIARTWKPKEIAPPIATPHIGGPIAYWIEYLHTSQLLVNRLEPLLEGLDLQSVLFPHFISGPLDAGQRIDFLAFHIRRHHSQILAMLECSDFPAN